MQFIRNQSLDDTIIRALVKAGRDKQAESLLLFTEEQYESHAKNASESGETNFFIAEQIAKRFTFFAEQRRFDDASAVLNEILAEKFAYAKYELSRHYLFNQLNETFGNFAKSGAVETRQKALNWAQQLLTWQLKHYEADDYRICNTELELAILNEHNTNWSEAVNNYSSALSTAIKYGAEGEKYTRPIAGLERIAAALTSQLGVNDNLLPQIGKTLAQAKEDTDKIKALNKEPIDARAEAETIARFASVEKLAPYSVSAGNYLSHLSRLYERNANWTAAPALASATVEYQRHTSPDLPKMCWPGNSWSYTNHGLILLAVQALLRTSTPASATDFLKEQMQVLKDEATFDDYANDARAADLIGGHELALSMWKKVVDRAESEVDTFILEREAISSLMQLKADNEVARAKEIVERLRSESNQRREAQRLAMEASKREGFLPAPVSALPYIFNYAALASTALTIGPNARLPLYDGPSQPWWYSFAGSFGTVQTTEPVLQSGRLSFIYHGSSDRFGPPASLISAVDFKPELVGTRFFYGPPAVPKLPFAPPPEVPSTAKRLSNVTKSQTLEPGDYLAPSGVMTCLDMMEKGRVRLFITDTASSKTGLTIACGGRVNGQRGDRPFDERGDNILPYQFEIWYGGKKPVRLEKGASFNGTIYAPEADVVLDDGARICGAVVARTITLNGQSAIDFVRR